MTDVPKLPAALIVTEQFTDGFMKDDLSLLGEFVQVVPFEMEVWQRHRTSTLWKRIRLLRNTVKLVYYLWRYDIQVVIFWFAFPVRTLLFAVISKLLLRKVLLITGGWDSIYLPEIDWGRLKHPGAQTAFGLLMRVVDGVLPFSNSAKEWITQHYQPRYIKTIYPAVDVNYFSPTLEHRQPRVVTCAYQYDEVQIVQKGLDTFVQAARHLPDVQFVVIGNAVGAKAEQFQQQAPVNVLFMPRIPTRAGYRDFLRHCSVYAQLSVHEGFGVSLAEAMACGCLPVVTDRFSLPEVVGDCGWVIPYGAETAKLAAHAIQHALASDGSMRKQARERVVRKFNKHIRRHQFGEELGHLLPGLARRSVRLELGCGSTGIPGTIGVDLRMTARTQAVCDVRQTCFATACADEVYSFCVLEHLENPYELMDEIVRLLKPNGQAFLRVPNLGTFSAHLDMTHRFLADMRLWKEIMYGYFEEVDVIPIGTKYRDNRLLVGLNRFLIKVLKFYELTQGWTFVCRRKRANPTRRYIGWWQEVE